MADEVEGEVTEDVAEDVEGQGLRTRTNRSPEGEPGSDPQRTRMSASDEDVEGQSMVIRTRNNRARNNRTRNN